MKDKELWMDKLKEKLSDYSEPAPDSGWEQLEKELATPVERKIVPHRKWAVAAAAGLLVAVSSVSLYFLSTPTADEIRYMPEAAVASTPDVLPKTIVPDAGQEKIIPVIRPTDKAYKNVLAKVETTNPSEPNVTNESKANDHQIVENEPVIDTNDTPEQTNGKQETKTHPQTKQVRQPYKKNNLFYPVEKPIRQRGKWSMGLSVGNSGGATTEGGTLSPRLARVNMASVSNGFLTIPNGQALVFEEGIPYLRQVKEQVVDFKHHQPISVGVSVRKGLPKGFSVETGLVYTLLSSDAKIADNNREIEQKLHYIGIPLRANWNFVDKKLVTFYVSGGGMVEKCVYGKLGSEKETVKPLQLSVNGAIGAQVNATQHIGIYVEPGVAYFFDDGSVVNTIRKENPLNFNVQAGIRFTY